MTSMSASQAHETGPVSSAVASTSHMWLRRHAEIGASRAVANDIAIQDLRSRTGRRLREVTPSYVRDRSQIAKYKGLPYGARHEQDE